MNSRRFAFVVLGVVALVAVSLSAATLTTYEESSGGRPGPEGGERPASGLSYEIGGGGGFGYLMIGFFFLFAAASLLAFLRYPVDTIKSAAASALGGAIAVVMILAMLWAGDTSSSKGASQEAQNQSEYTPSPTGGSGGLGPESGDKIGEGATAFLQEPSLLVLLSLGVILVSVVAIAIMGVEDDEPESTGEYEPEPGGQLAEMGRIAGAAADRLDASAAVDNEVYRAWKEMTALLSLPEPTARTPGEFRRAAIEVGMAPPDVDELTELFEEVRYGGADADEGREARAQSALRRIEAAYAEPDGSAGEVDERRDA